MATGNWLDRAIGFVAPQAGLRRARARQATQFLARHYEAAATGRRTQGWRRTAADANAALGPAIGTLRNTARDLVRNNGYAESALATICDHVVGYGIKPKPVPTNMKAAELWKSWAWTTACDADGMRDFAGLQRLVMRTVVEAGEVLVRRRVRRPEDELPIPLQLQVIDPDYLDTSKNAKLGGGARIINGVELDPIGRRRAYWLFPEHPGSDSVSVATSSPVSAENVLHIFRADRPGQMRGVSWFAPVLLKFKDFDDFDDATLMKQKIAACLAVIVNDPDGTGVPIGGVDAAAPTIESLEPGAILRPGAGSIEVVQPPSVREYPDYTRTTLRGIATGLGVTYEDLTGDFSAVSFSSARMARLKHWARVEEWRWQMVIPQFCTPVWMWAMQAAQIMGLAQAGGVEWTCSPMPMIEPDKEGLAYQRMVRSGLKSLSESIRELGYDPEIVLEEIAEDNAKLDRLGLVLDSDARKTTQAGNPVKVAEESEPQPMPADDDDDDAIPMDDDGDRRLRRMRA